MPAARAVDEGEGGTTRKPTPDHSTTGKYRFTSRTRVHRGRSALPPPIPGPAAAASAQENKSIILSLSTSAAARRARQPILWRATSSITEQA